MSIDFSSIDQKYGSSEEPQGPPAGGNIDFSSIDKKYQASDGSSPSAVSPTMNEGVQKFMAGVDQMNAKFAEDFKREESPQTFFPDVHQTKPLEGIKNPFDAMQAQVRGIKAGATAGAAEVPLGITQLAGVPETSQFQPLSQEPGGGLQNYQQIQKEYQKSKEEAPYATPLAYGATRVATELLMGAGALKLLKYGVGAGAAAKTAGYLQSHGVARGAAQAAATTAGAVGMEGLAYGTPEERTERMATAAILGPVVAGGMAAIKPGIGYLAKTKAGQYLMDKTSAVYNKIFHPAKVAATKMRADLQAGLSSGQNLDAEILSQMKEGRKAGITYSPGQAFPDSIVASDEMKLLVGNTQRRAITKRVTEQAEAVTDELSGMLDTTTDPKVLAKFAKQKAALEAKQISDDVLAEIKKNPQIEQYLQKANEVAGPSMTNLPDTSVKKLRGIVQEMSETLSKKGVPGENVTSLQVKGLEEARNTLRNALSTVNGYDEYMKAKQPFAIKTKYNEILNRKASASGGVDKIKPATIKDVNTALFNSQTKREAFMKDMKVLGVPEEQTKTLMDASHVLVKSPLAKIISRTPDEDSAIFANYRSEHKGPLGFLKSVTESRYRAAVVELHTNPKWYKEVRAIGKEKTKVGKISKYINLLGKALDKIPTKAKTAMSRAAIGETSAAITASPEKERKGLLTR